MTKEEFINKYSDSKKCINVINQKLEKRIINILKVLDIQYLRKYIVDCGYYIFLTSNKNDEIDTTNLVSNFDFIDEWETLPESENDKNKIIIDDYLKENNFSFCEDSYKIEKINTLIGILNADWINLNTTKDYSIYWTNYNTDLIISLRNKGSYFIKF